jgi:hypothetical protein
MANPELNPTDGNTPDPKHGIDTRCWGIGLIGGASTIAWFPIRKIEGMSSFAENVDMAIAFFAVTIVPVILVTLARRRWLLWPLLPSTIAIATMVVFDRYFRHEADPISYCEIWLEVCAFAIVSSLPAAGIRAAVIRRRNKTPAPPNENETATSAAGSWPRHPANVAKSQDSSHDKTQACSSSKRIRWAAQKEFQS